MDEIERLIAQFRAENTSGLGDPGKSRKPGIVDSLARYSSDTRAFEFLLQIASDANELDLVRIDVLKFLEVREPATNHERLMVASVLRNILSEDPDDLVRGYAAMAARCYMDDDRLFKEMSDVLLNPKEDVDLRFNAFAVLERMGASPRTLSIMWRVGQDATLSKSAKRVLASWNAANHG